MEKSLNIVKFDVLNLIDIDKSSKNLIILKVELITKGKKQTTELETAKQELIESLKKEIQDPFVVFFFEYDSEINKLKGVGLSFREKAELIQNFTNYDEEQKTFIYVITPKGDVQKIDQGSTCVDFAYSIHEEVGNQCHGAKVNGQIVTLDTCLKNGDRVEVITQKSSHPNPHWLYFVKTSSARQKIERWLRRKHWEQNITLGRELLQKELSKTADSFPQSDLMNEMAKKINYHNFDALLAALGYGKVSLNKIVNLIQESRKNQQSKENNLESSNTKVHKLPSDHIYSPSQSPINGVEGIVYRLARCCNPIPTEPIVGIVTCGTRGISIHTEECNNWKKIPVERQISVSWNPKADQQTYSVGLRIKVFDKLGVLNEISYVLKKAEINIQKAYVDPNYDGTTTIRLTIDIPYINEIVHSEKLEQILARIRKKKTCISCTRTTLI